MQPSYALSLKSTREASQRLWNNPKITAEEKRKASEYFAEHRDELHKLARLNERLGTLITERTPIHQR